ncbi:MAG: MarR family winged helix-turn-helix transcriptional regulator [Steroidobacteraceae bacterium]
MKRIRQVSSLETHLGYWLRYVSNQVSHAFSRKVQARGVTVAEWVVLRELYDNELTPSTLAYHLGLTRGAVSKLAERLAAKRLVAQRPRAGDARSLTLALTAEGREIVPVLAGLADENDEEFFGCLDMKLRKTIESAMRQLCSGTGSAAHRPIDRQCRRGAIHERASKERST